MGFMNNRGVEVLFSIFLGILVAAFVGVGVYTFYPPSHEYEERILELNSQRRALIDSRPLANLTAEERQQLREIDNQLERARAASHSAYERWGRTTSIILVSVATLAMAISVVGDDRLPVISSGLLLGGVLTMLYGVGWIIATDSALSRFAVIAVALVTTLSFGYIRFVRRSSALSAEDTPAAEGVEALSSIERRLRNLEKKLEDAAAALGGDSR